MHVVLISLLLAAEPPVEALGAKAYKGPEGQLVEVVTLKPLDAKRALVRITGAGSPADGLVLATSIDAARAFTARIRGADWVVLRLDEGRGTAAPPDVKEFRLKFDEAATGRVDATDLVAKHQAQRESGELAMLAKKEFPILVKKYEGKAAEAVAALGRKCGAAPSFSFTWWTFSDADMGELDAWAACKPLVAALEGRCAAAKGVTKLACRMGPKLALERTGDTLTFTTTAKGAADGAAFVSSQLGK